MFTSSFLTATRTVMGSCRDMARGSKSDASAQSGIEEATRLAVIGITRIEIVFPLPLATLTHELLMTRCPAQSNRIPVIMFAHEGLCPLASGLAQCLVLQPPA